MKAPSGSFTARALLYPARISGGGRIRNFDYKAAAQRGDETGNLVKSSYARGILDGRDSFLIHPEQLPDLRLA